MSKKYALLIGVDDQYKDGLKLCSKDVNDIANVLTKYCKYNDSNIFKLQSFYNNENIDLHNDYLQILSELKTKLTKTDTLFIYFSGHGEFEKSKKKSYLIFPSNKISTEEIKQFVDECNSPKTIIVLDACHIGANVLSKTIHTPKLKRKLDFDSDGLYAIYGSPVTRKAYIPEALDNSLLTHFFIQALENIDNYNENGFLTIDRIADICSSNVYNYSAELVKSHKISEEQIIVKEGRIEGCFIFAERDVPQNIKRNIKKKKKLSTEPKDKVNVNKSNNIADKDFNSLLEDVQSKLQCFTNVISAYLLSKYYHKEYNVSDRSYKRDIEEAIRKNYFDDEGYINDENLDVQNLYSSISNFTSYLDANNSDEFNSNFLSKYNCYADDYDNQVFWEMVYDAVIP